MDENAKREKLTELIKDASIGMLVTVNSDGEFESRPMAIQEAEFDGDIWFFAYENEGVTTDIEARPQVNVSIADQKNQAWVSVSGTGAVVRDKVKAKELWSPLYKTYFPDGLETPGLILLKVQAKSAQYWDAPSSKVVQLLGMVKGLVTGKEVNQGENETLTKL
jgi:general stress protein 26